MTRGFEGSPPFPEGARIALANPQLRRNMANATHTIRAKRDRVVAELDTWEDLRLAAEAIKNQALGHLDELIVTLEERITAAGGTVHFARDADEACATVVDLVAATGAERVVKVKSMTTVEIRLNQALEAAGITPYETDLAELIVQLGDDLPSHIVVPAIHRSRAEIREVFVEHMGERGRPAPEGLTDDPAALAGAARAHLRERFLETDVGISGGNFLVAETGSVVVVESEGNGRMCVTLPRTLISVVGIDKIIPTWADLDTFLQLLPRSATGERMNPYNSVWTGVTPGDGPQEFHVVLVDNGRTHALADTVGRQALRCIRCAACLNVCPVYERVGGHAYGSVYPGPIGAVLTPQLDHVATDDVAASLPYASTLCGACFDACPVRIDIPRLLVHLRADVVDAKRHAAGDEAAAAESPAPPTTRPAPSPTALGGRATDGSWRHRLSGPRRWPSQEQATMAGAAWVLARPGRLDAVARGGALASRLIGSHRLRLPGYLGGWTTWRTTPLPTEPSFASWWRQTHPETVSAPGRAKRWPSLPRPFLSTPALTRPAERAASVPVASVPVAEPDDARREILERITAGLGPQRPTVPIPRDYRRALVEQPDDLVAHFASRVNDYRAQVVRIPEADLAPTVARLLAEHGSSSVAVPPDLPSAWLADVAAEVVLRRDDPALGLAELDGIDSVVTASAAAIAETGTVILDGGAGQGRRALTLVPDHHVVVVRHDAVVAGVADVMSRIDPTGPQTWISGPSATSDIELNRVEGVHGPRHLDVVIIDAAH